MRTCKTCGVEKSLMDFYSQTNGNLQRDCKECWKAYVKANRLVRVDQYRERDKARAMLPHRVEMRARYRSTEAGKEAVRRGARAWDNRNPLKKAATTAVNNAIRDGRLTRQPCEQCGAVAQAHHDDYSKPLEVRWLCTKHHREWHKHNTPKCPEQEKAA